jgi:hypothetical protein
MKKLSLCAAALSLCVGTAAMLPSGRFNTSSSTGESSLGEDILSNQHRSGAFRDGLYLGRLAAERGQPHHVARGRWATADNRALFAAGYEQGYHQVAPTAANAGQQIADCTSAVQRRAACQPILN